MSFKESTDPGSCRVMQITGPARGLLMISHDPRSVGHFKLMLDLTYSICFPNPAQEQVMRIPV